MNSTSEIYPSANTGETGRFISKGALGIEQTLEEHKKPQGSLTTLPCTGSMIKLSSSFSTGPGLLGGRLDHTNPQNEHNGGHDGC